MRRSEVQEAVNEAVAGAQASIVQGVKEALAEDTKVYGALKNARARLKELNEEIEKLTIERDRKQEDHDREERELKHMIGLERKRQEFEIEQAKREATVSVQEGNLVKDRERFEDQMKFHEERFTKEVGYLQDILARVLERLPNVDVAINGPKGEDDG